MQRRTKREDTRVARGAAMVAGKMHAVDAGAGVVPARQGLASLVRHEPPRPQHLSGRQSKSNEDDDNDDDEDGEQGQAEDGTPLRFTFDVDHTQPACRDISLSYAGGCKPYTLKAMWFYTADKAAQDPGQTTWIKISEETWKNSFNWTVIAPVSSQLLFSITDANGKTITSQDAILVRSNGLGLSIDTWCQYGYGPGGSSAFPLAPTASSHRYAWNASSNGASDNGNGQDDEPNPYSKSLDGEIATSTATATQTQQYPGTIKTSSPASMTKVTLGTVQYSGTETRTWDPNATDLNDRSTTYSKAIHDADHAKVLESVLAALLALSLLALATLFFFLLKTRKRLRQARTELAAYSAVNGGGSSYGQHGANGHGGAMMSEKRGEGQQRREDVSAITPRANGNMRNPFDEHMQQQQQQQQQNRNSPFFLGVPGTPNANGNRMSTTSLVSTVPSHTRSTAAESAVSTEFYHTYKASTIPPKGAREGWPDMNDMMTSANTNANSSSSGSHTTSAAGRLRGLFGAGGPMSFFSSASSATASPAMSSTTRRSAATDSLAPTISRSSMTAGSDVTRPTSMSRNGSAETIQVPITRVSTRSDSSSTNTNASSIRRLGNTGARLTPSTASVSGRSSSGNGADESSIQGDAYDDSDVASFSNFSFVDTFSTADEEEATAKRHAFNRADTNVFSDANAVDHPSLLARGLLQPEGGRSTPSLGGSDAYDDEDEDAFAGTFKQQATSPRWSHRLSSRQ